MAHTYAIFVPPKINAFFAKRSRAKRGDAEVSKLTLRSKNSGANPNPLGLLWQHLHNQLHCALELWQPVITARRLGTPQLHLSLRSCGLRQLGTQYQHLSMTSMRLRLQRMQCIVSALLQTSQDRDSVAALSESVARQRRGRTSICCRKIGELDNSAQQPVTDCMEGVLKV